MFIQLSADWWFPTEKYESQWEETKSAERRNAGMRFQVIVGDLREKPLRWWHKMI